MDVDDDDVDDADDDDDDEADDDDDDADDDEDDDEDGDRDNHGVGEADVNDDGALNGYTTAYGSETNHRGYCGSLRDGHSNHKSVE